MSLGMALPGGPIIQAIGGLRATAWLTLAILLAVATGVQSCRLDSAQDKLAKRDDAVAKWQEVDKANRESIAKLLSATARWERLYASDEKAGGEAVKRHQAEQKRLAAQLAAKEKELEDFYAKHPAARQWSRAGIPAGVADRLLDDVPRGKDGGR